MSRPPTSGPLQESQGGSSTPDIPGLVPGLPTAVPNNYTPDQNYGNIQQTQVPALGHKKHRWFMPKDIGVVTKNAGNVEVIVSPLTTAANRVTYDFQQAPDFFLISTMVNTAAAVLLIWLGDGGGSPIRLGNGGYVRIPAGGETKITLQALAQSVAGTIIAVAGYEDSEIALDCASQP